MFQAGDGGWTGIKEGHATLQNHVASRSKGNGPDATKRIVFQHFQGIGGSFESCKTPLLHLLILNPTKRHTQTREIDEDFEKNNDLQVRNYNPLPCRILLKLFWKRPVRVLGKS